MAPKQLLLLLLLLPLQIFAQCTATITPSGATSFCQGGSVVLHANTGTGYHWQVNGGPINGATDDSLVVTTAGSYTVIVDSGSCSATSAAVDVLVGAPAQPGPISGNAVVCSDTTETFSVIPVAGATSYTWAVDVGQPSNSSWQQFISSSTSNTITGPAGYTLSASGQVTLKVTANNACGSSTASTLTIMDYTRPFIGGVDPNPDHVQEYCPGLNPTTIHNAWHPDYLGYVGHITFQWYRNGVTSATDTGYYHIITKGGTYLEVDSNPGCSTSYSRYISQDMPIPSIYPAGPITMCQGSNVTLNCVMDNDGYSGNPFTFLWNTPGSFGYNNQYSVTPTQAGNYSINISAPWIYIQNAPAPCTYATQPVAVTFSTAQTTPIMYTQNGNVLTATPGYATYQWYRNGVLITGATTNTYTTTSTGAYMVFATDGNGCGSMYQPGLEEANLQSRNHTVTVYPSPNDGIFTVNGTIKTVDNNVRLQIVDLSGRVVSNEDIKTQRGSLDHKINISNMAAGMYILKIISDSENQVISFVKR